MQSEGKYREGKQTIQPALILSLGSLWDNSKQS